MVFESDFQLFPYSIPYHPLSYIPVSGQHHHGVATATTAATACVTSRAWHRQWSRTGGEWSVWLIADSWHHAHSKPSQQTSHNMNDIFQLEVCRGSAIKPSWQNIKHLMNLMILWFSNPKLHWQYYSCDPSVLFKITFHDVQQRLTQRCPAYSLAFLSTSRCQQCSGQQCPAVAGDSWWLWGWFSFWAQLPWYHESI